MMTNSVAYLSYTHVDDEFHDRAITALSKKLSMAVQVKTGRPFPIFQDHEDIDWGQRWPKVLDDALNEVRFLIPVISPSFFTSDWCRKELGRFFEIEAEQGRDDLIFPLYWETSVVLEDDRQRAEDTLATFLAERQRFNWRPFLHKPLSDYDVKLAIDKLALGLKAALERSETSVASPLNQTFKKPTFDPLPNRSGLDQQDKQDDYKLRLEGAIQSGLMEQGAPSYTKDKLVIRDFGESWCPEMVVIPDGMFDMGSPSEEAERSEDEGPQHLVRIERPFALGRYPVTFAEYDRFAEETGRKRPDDRGWGRDRRPVVNVNLADAEAYLTWLSENTGASYRLPSEAEWEYACRAQTTTPFWTGNIIVTEQANYDGRYPYGDSEKGEYREQTTNIRDFRANPFGLYDMHGNVWEWVQDRWHASYKGAPDDGSAWLIGGDSGLGVLRGGSWFSNAQSVRSARRYVVPLDCADDFIGFRCARDWGEESQPRGWQ